MIHSIIDAYPFNTSDPADLERRLSAIKDLLKIVKTPPTSKFLHGGGVYRSKGSKPGAQNKNSSAKDRTVRTAHASRPTSP